MGDHNNGEVTGTDGPGSEGDDLENAEALSVLAERALSDGDDNLELLTRLELAELLVTLHRAGEARIHAYRGLSLARELGLEAVELRLQTLLDDDDDSEEPELDPAFDHALSEGQTHFLNGRFDSATISLKTALQLAESAESVEAQVGAHAFLSQIYLAAGDLAAGREQGQLALDIAVELGEDEALPFLMDLAEVPDKERALLAIAEGRSALEDRDCPKVLLLLNPVADAMADAMEWELEASARGLLAQAQARFSNNAKAVDEAKRAFDIARMKGNRESVARFRELVDAIPRGDFAPWPEGSRTFSAQIQSAVALAEGGDMDGAVVAIRAVVVGARAERARSSEATARHIEGQILLALDRDEEAKKTLDLGLALAREMDDSAAIASFEVMLGLGS